MTSGDRRLLPGSVAEIDASPEGPQVAAFFDFDGTLIAGYSASAMASERMRRGDFSIGDITRSITAGVQVGLGHADMGDFMKLTATAWNGRTHAELVELGERIFVQKIADWVYPEARELVLAHQRRGHTVVLTSSATRYQIGGIARELAIDEVLCTELEIEDDLLTGNVLEPALWGQGKAKAVQKFAADNGVDMAASYFYADGDEDIGLMHLVGKPRPTNPRRRMEQAARRHGWPVQKFTSRGKTNLATRVRSGAGWVAMAPFAVASVGIAAVRRNRRAGTAATSTRWIDVMLAATGIELNIVGREHLSTDRPAVFIFNHRTDFDPVIAAAVVRDDVVGLIRSDAAGRSARRTLARIADVIVTVDGDGTDAESRAKATTLVAQQGLSILAAPEQPRDFGERLGGFDPTAFRVAMAAGVPVIPIVIRNADHLGPRHAKALRSGTVDVAVLPPVATDGWTERSLATRIKGVRNAYAATLDDWPS